VDNCAARPPSVPSPKPNPERHLVALSRDFAAGGDRSQFPVMSTHARQGLEPARRASEAPRTPVGKQPPRTPPCEAAAAAGQLTMPGEISQPGIVHQWQRPTTPRPSPRSPADAFGWSPGPREPAPRSALSRRPARDGRRYAVEACGEHRQPLEHARPAP
jgi:hypothetical protein